MMAQRGNISSFEFQRKVQVSESSQVNVFLDPCENLIVHRMTMIDRLRRRAEEGRNMSDLSLRVQRPDLARMEYTWLE